MWRVETGHAIRLEIVNGDVPYMRPSIVPSSTEVSDVTLRLPIRN
jgi:hypothetical protein